MYYGTVGGTTGCHSSEDSLCAFCYRFVFSFFTKSIIFGSLALYLSFKGDLKHSSWCKHIFWIFFFFSSIWIVIFLMPSHTQNKPGKDNFAAASSHQPFLLTHFSIPNSLSYLGLGQPGKTIPWYKSVSEAQSLNWTFLCPIYTWKGTTVSSGRTDTDSDSWIGYRWQWGWSIYFNSICIYYILGLPFLFKFKPIYCCI